MSGEILIVGCGSIGSRHARNLKTIGKYAISVFDTDISRSETLAKELSLRSFKDLSQALRENPVAVVVCSPPSEHISHAKLGVQAGASVFIEKPLATRTGADLDELLALASAHGVELMVGFNLRFNRCIRKAKDLVDKGELGALQNIEATFGQYLPDWRPGADYRNGYITGASENGGGVLHDVFAHEADYVTWIAGDVELVSCVAGNVSDLEMKAEDTAETTLKFRSGAIGRIHADCVRPNYTRRMQIVGSLGSVEWDIFSGLRIKRQGSAEWTSIEPPVNPDEAYVLEMERFLSVIEGNARAEVDGDRAKWVLELVEAARRSADRGRVSLVQ